MCKVISGQTKGVDILLALPYTRDKSGSNTAKLTGRDDLTIGISLHRCRVDRVVIASLGLAPKGLGVVQASPGMERTARPSDQASARRKMWSRLKSWKPDLLEGRGK